MNQKEERLIKVLIKSAIIDYARCGGVQEVHPGAGPCCAWGCINTKHKDGPRPKGWHTLFSNQCYFVKTATLTSPQITNRCPARLKLLEWLKEEEINVRVCPIDWVAFYHSQILALSPSTPHIVHRGELILGHISPPFKTDTQNKPNCSCPEKASLSS